MKIVNATLYHTNHVEEIAWQAVAREVQRMKALGEFNDGRPVWLEMRRGYLVPETPGMMTVCHYTPLDRPAAPNQLVLPYPDGQERVRPAIAIAACAAGLTWLYWAKPGMDFPVRFECPIREAAAFGWAADCELLTERETLKRGERDADNQPERVPD